MWYCGIVTAAYEFYGRFFGWKYCGDDTKPIHTDGVWSHTDQPIYAGYQQFPFKHIDSAQRPAWIIYLRVPDVYASVAKAVTLGAKLHKPMETIDVWGTFAVLGDPTGATFALYQEKGTPLKEIPIPVYKPVAAAVGASFSEAKKAVAAAAPKRETHGVFCWYDYMTTEPAKAEKFYTELLKLKAKNVMPEYAPTHQPISV